MSSPRRNEIIKKRRLCSCFTKSVSLPRTGAHRCAPCRRVALFSDLPSWFRLKNFLFIAIRVKIFQKWSELVVVCLRVNNEVISVTCLTVSNARRKESFVRVMQIGPVAQREKEKSLKIKIASHPKNWCFIYSMPCRWMQLILLIASFAYDDLFIREVLTCLNCNRISFPKSIFE